MTEKIAMRIIKMGDREGERGTEVAQTGTNRIRVSELKFVRNFP